MSRKTEQIVTNFAKKIPHVKRYFGIKKFPYHIRNQQWIHSLETGCLVPFTKPYGFTSRDMLNILQREFSSVGKKVKMGHGGTLDPMAVGLVIVAFNKATRALPELLNCDKSYKFKIKLGEATQSYDRESAITHRSDNWRFVTLPDLEGICNGFLGFTQQTVPLYSAVHYKGKRLYEYAYNDIQVPDLPSKEIFIEQVDVSNFDGQTADIFVKCSKGTYVRTLAHDIGMKLGCYAHTIELERMSVGPYLLEEAWTIDEFLSSLRQSIPNKNV